MPTREEVLAAERAAAQPNQSQPRRGPTREQVLAAEAAAQGPDLRETAIDAARSFGTGLQRGITGIMGLPGDVQALGNWASEQGVRFGARLTGRDLSEDEIRATGRAANMLNIGGDLPRSHQITETIEQVQGRPQYEPQTTAGEYARTVGEFAPAAVSPGGAMTRIVRAVAPAAASETAGQFTEGTEAEPWARLGAALLTAGVTESTVGMLTRGGRTPDERAIRLIARELSDANYDPDQIVRIANQLRRQAPTEEILAELMGPSGQRLSRATAAMGRGAGRSTAERVLNERANGAPPMRASGGQPGQPRITSIRDRIMHEAARMTHPQQTRAPSNYWDALDALRTARSGQGREAYRAAHAFTPDAEQVNSQIIPYMREAPREAFASGARQLETEAARVRARLSTAASRGTPEEQINALRTELDDILTGRQQLVLFAQGQAPNTVNSRAMDYFQRGMLQMERAAGRGSPEAGAMREARSAFNEMADQINPRFADARSRYGESIRIEDYMDEGRRVFNMSEGEIDRLMRGNGRGLTTEEFDGFMLGVMDAIETKLGTSDTGFLARLTRNKNWRDQLTRAVGGEAQARRFLTRLERESAMQGTRNYVLSGSRTEPVKQDILALTEGEAELSFTADAVQRFVSSGGSLQRLGAQILSGIYDRVHRPGIANPQVQEAMARRLFARATRDNARELRDAILAARNDPGLPSRVRDWARNVDLATVATTDARVEGEGGGAARAYLDARRAAEDHPGAE